MARTAEVKIIPGPEVRQWARKFGRVGQEMTRRSVPLFNLVVGQVFEETQALVHEYPEGSTFGLPGGTEYPPTLRDISRSGRLRKSGKHLGAKRIGEFEVNDAIGYLVPWAEFERTGTTRSIPPGREHDFMAPWIPGMEYLGEGIDEIWDEIWRT